MITNNNSALIIENNPIDRKFMQNTLESWNFNVRAENDLAKVRSKPIVQKLFMQRVNYQIDKQSERNALLDEVYTWGNMTLDVPQCEFRIGEKIVPLTKTELLLTQAFFAEPERVISRPELLNVIKVKDGIGSSHLIDTHLSRLRIKIKENGGGDHIYSIRGLGVRFMAPSHLARKSS